MATSQEYTISRKVSDTEEEIIQIPYGALANKPDLSVYQTKTDASLKTNDKTVVGAINEVVTGVAGTLESFGMSLAPQENGKLNKKVYVYPDGYFSQGTSYDASKDLYLSIGDGLTLETIDEANNIWNIKSGSAITSVDGLGGGAISGNVSTTGSLAVGGNLTVNGTTTTVDSTTLQVKDKLIEVAHGNTTALTTPAGLVAPKYDGTNSGALVFDSTGTAYVGDVTLKDGNIDVANSGLQPLATRTGLVGGNLVQYDSTAQTLKDSGKKISDLATTSQVNAKYTKPSGGIPKTDLASDVQTSLGKADSALQAKDISGKLDKTTYEVNKTIEFGYSGVLYVGKFKVYDTNVTCEVTSTTNVTYSGKLVIATQNNVIQQMTVYGDAANTVAPNFFIKPSTTSDPYIEIYFKPASWSKNVVHIYGSAIAAEPTNVCTNVSAVPSTATLKPTNALDSKANVSSLANVATSGSYNDLSNKPTIPTVNNGTLTIQKNGTTVATFSANQSTNTTANITVPTKTSQLTNDSNFVKSNSGAFTGNLTADNFNSRFSLQSVPYGTAVGENADLNTVTYLSVGNYYCGADAIVSTMTNVPVKRAFMMTVYSPLTPTVDNETTGKWVYRVRKFMTYLGEEYIQSVYSGNTAGTFTYNNWQQIAHKSDIPSVPTFSLSGTTLTITL